MTSAVITALLLWVGLTLWNVSIDVATINQDVKLIRSNELPHLERLIERNERRLERLEGFYQRQP
ncbi:hypothetical protein LCGC14_2956740 [marine sediment metagenome]|uniref:Uncharacterized protein n=1 Tax=marine sediment metagenome TaxID=412755 RepID=A0A0F8XE92_9ZZZZ